MRLAAILALGLGACTTQYVEREALPNEELPVRKATFPGTPDILNASFRQACDDPGDVYARPARGVQQCRTPPTPDLAAFLLLQFDGALEVPAVVIQTEEKRTTDGVLVGFSYFAEVPQKSGPARRIYFRDTDLDDFIDLLLVASGGTLPVR